MFRSPLKSPFIPNLHSVTVSQPLNFSKHLSMKASKMQNYFAD